MSPSKAEVHAVVDVYLRAWVTQDPELIVSIFTPTAVYHELADESRAAAEPHRSAEWEPRFDDLAADCRKRMQEVAIGKVRRRQDRQPA